MATKELRNEAWHAVFVHNNDDLAFFDTSHDGDTDDTDAMSYQ